MPDLGESVRSMNIPLYVGLALLAIGAIGGAFTGLVVLGSNASIDDLNADTVVDVQLLYSNECAICEKNNTIFDALSQNGIPYNREDILFETEQGKQMAELYGITTLPAAIVETESMQHYTDFRRVMDNLFQEKKGKYIVPESSIDRNPHNIMFIESPEPGCKVEKGKARVDEFIDYFCPGCSRALAAIASLKAQFGSSVEFNIRNFVINDEPAEKVAVAAECARIQGKFDGFENCIFRKKFSENLDTTDKNVLLGCAAESGISALDDFEACVDNEETISIVDIDLGSDNLAAKSYGLAWAPSYVIDCKFTTVGEGTLKGNICALHPELEAC